MRRREKAKQRQHVDKTTCVCLAVIGIVGIIQKRLFERVQTADQTASLRAITEVTKIVDMANTSKAANITHRNYYNKTVPAFLTRGLPETYMKAVLDDMQVMTGCGFFKCFFPSKSEANMGWIVTKSHRYYQVIKESLPVLPFAFQAHTFAMQAQEKYGMRHFFTPQPPFLTGRLSQKNKKLFASKFNATLCDKELNDCRLSWLSPFGFVMQKVKKAPSDAIVAKFFISNLKKDDPANQSSMVPSSLLTLKPPWNNKTAPSATFCSNLRNDLQTTRRLLDDFPAFAVDFQILFTLDSGEVYHLDLDRMFDADLNPEHWRDKFAPHVRPALQALETQLCGSNETVGGERLR